MNKSKRLPSATLALLLASATQVSANPTIIAQLEKEVPNVYSATRADCEQWAINNMIEDANKPAYIQSCVINQIGYMVGTEEG